MSQIVLHLKDHAFAEGALPKPSGFRLLIQPIDVAETSAGGIALVTDTQEAQRYNRYVGKVMAIGPDAYHAQRTVSGGSLMFPTGPWCREGDWVVFSQYSGAAINVCDTEGEVVSLRFINDDSVLAVADTPEALLVKV